MGPTLVGRVGKIVAAKRAMFPCRPARKRRELHREVSNKSRALLQHTRPQLELLAEYRLTSRLVGFSSGMMVLDGAMSYHLTQATSSGLQGGLSSRSNSDFIFSFSLR